MRRLLLACLLAMLPAAARADDPRGVYLGLGAGLDVHTQRRPGASVTAGEVNVQRASRRFDPGARVGLQLGYGFGNGVRVEAEGFLLGARNAASRAASVGAGGHEGVAGVAGLMANVLYDLDFKRLGWGAAPLGATPYVGAGLGVASVGQSNLPGVGQPGHPLDYRVSHTGFAGQIITGVAVPLGFVPGLAATLEYRAVAVTGGGSVTKSIADGGTRATIRASAPAVIDQSLLLGLRYSFGG